MRPLLGITDDRLPGGTSHAATENLAEWLRTPPFPNSAALRAHMSRSRSASSWLTPRPAASCRA